MGLILGIETSCDETAAALVDPDCGQGERIIGERVLSQWDDHRPYGGVVPEVAARAHLAHLLPLVRDLLTQSKTSWSAIDAIAATTGPGLIGGVIVGATFGKALALAQNKPFLAINHLEAHALSVRLTEKVEFPYLLLLVSGGHCQILLIEGLGRYQTLGRTVDDALGEAFDKTAKMLGLGYPGGPAVEDAAKTGKPDTFTLPVPMKGRPGFDFSFSGLKTAVRQAIEKQPTGPLDDQIKSDLCLAFQVSAAESLRSRSAKAIAHVMGKYQRPLPFVVAGGVAANQTLRRVLEQLATEHETPFFVPPVKLCTDNAAMVAWAGAERYRAGQEDSLATKPVPRWPLDDLRPPLSDRH